jgi:hypothetical protein
MDSGLQRHAVMLRAFVFEDGGHGTGKSGREWRESARHREVGGSSNVGESGRELHESVRMVGKGMRAGR